MDLTERQLSRETIYEGKILHIYRDDVLLPNGRTSVREVADHPGGVAIVALDENDNVLTVKQYRYVFSRVLEEIPAGKLERGEDPDEAALRELKEETGATPKRMTNLGKLLVSPGCYSEVLHLYLAEGLTFGEQNPDEDEFLELYRTPFDEMLARVMRGEIEDAKTVCGILKVSRPAHSAKRETGERELMEQKKTVLIVEDEKNIVDIIRFNLQRTGYDTLEAYDGEAGLAMAREKKPDLILLDVMMPKMMGFDVCRALRAEGDNVPVIILTAREEEEDKILGLEIGADDYITKPFSMRELLARVKANIRRTTMLSAPAAEDNAMSAGGGITINTDSFQVRKNGVPIDLTQREYELLTFLASHPGKVFSRVDLMEQVWNYGYVGDDARTVDVTVRRLREKIEDNPAAPAYILTRRGVGYYFSAQA